MTFSFRRFISVLLCCCWSFASAAENNKAGATALTDTECETFGRELATAVNRGKPLEMVRPLDYAAFGKRAVDGIEMSEKDRGDFLRGLIGSLRTGMERQFGVWKNARFVRVSTVNGEKRILVRVIAEGGALNFLDWVCARDERGGIKFVDLFSYLTAELLSETTRRGVLPFFAEKQRGFLDRLTKGESAYVRSFPKIGEAMKSFRSGEAAKAMKILEDLPEGVKATPFCLLMRLQVAQAADEKTYHRVIEEWEKTHPGDPSLDLVSIDGCVARKDYDGCIRHLDSLQKRVGADGYLQAMKANVFVMAGEIEKAHTTIKDAIAKEPALANSYDIWFNVEMQAKDWTGLAEALTTFDKNFPTSDIWVGIQAEESWAPFRESDACKSWLEKRAEKKTAAETK